MNPVLTFDAQGTVQCLHTDVIPLQSLGTMEVHRASTLEFNPATQQWEVRDNGGQVLFSDPSRSCCLGWELAHFNR